MKSQYCFLRCTTAPVVHANADYILDVHYASEVAAKYSQMFGKDIFVQWWGYRRQGHNQIDEPRMTNVDLYHVMDRHKPVTEAALQSVKSTKLRTDMADIRQHMANEFKQISADEPIERARVENRMHRKASKWRNLWTHLPAAFDTHTDVSFEQLHRV